MEQLRQQNAQAKSLNRILREEKTLFRSGKEKKEKIMTKA